MSMSPHGDPMPPELEKVAEELEAAAFKLGLYVQGLTFVQPQDERGPIPGDPMVVAHFMIGENAFHNRVQDPESEKFDDSFRAIAREEQESDFERIQREAREAMKDAGGDPLAALRDEDDEDETPS